MRVLSKGGFIETMGRSKFTVKDPCICFCVCCCFGVPFVNVLYTGFFTLLVSEGWALGLKEEGRRGVVGW